MTHAIREMREALDRGDYAAANQENLAYALVEKGATTPVDCPHSVGRLEITFSPSTVFKKYRRGVDMQRGEAFVDFTVGGCHYRREAFVSRSADVTVTAHRDMDTSLLLLGRETCRVALTAGESKTLCLAR